MTFMAFSPDLRDLLAGMREPDDTPLHHQVRLHPERRLMLAVLYEALIDYERGMRGDLKDEPWVFRRVLAWFRSDDTRWPYSFVNVCEAVGLSPAAVRSALRRSRRPVRRTARAGWLGRRQSPEASSRGARVRSTGRPRVSRQARREVQS